MGIFAMMSDSPLSFMFPNTVIVAKEVEEGCYVDKNSKLVEFHATFVPGKFLDGSDCEFKESDYILPKPDPIYAPCSGIVQYTAPAEGEHEVWITSPFDKL